MERLLVAEWAKYVYEINCYTLRQSGLTTRDNSSSTMFDDRLCRIHYGKVGGDLWWGDDLLMDIRVAVYHR